MKLFGGTVPPNITYVAELFCQIKRSVVELFRQIKRSVAELFRQIKRSVAEQFRQIKCSVAEPHMEISFWFGKGDIPNEKIRLPPLEVHFGVGVCGRTDSAGGAGQE